MAKDYVVAIDKALMIEVGRVLMEECVYYYYQGHYCGLGSRPVAMPPATKILFDAEEEVSQDVPRNNDGRSSCWWCEEPTVRKKGFTSLYDFCEDCRK